MKQSNSIESLLFHYIDEVKFLFFPEKWTDVFLDYTKNEVFTMLYLYRCSFVTMTEIAEYMNAPLNTATGVVKRLEAKEVVVRERNEIDKRVVTVSLTEKGRAFIQLQLENVLDYYKQIQQQLTKEEMEMAFQIIDKSLAVLKNSKTEEGKEKKKVRKITIE